MRWSVAWLLALTALPLHSVADAPRPLDLVADLGAGGYLVALLEAGPSGGARWGGELSWRVSTPPGADASVLLLPFSPIVSHAPGLTPWPMATPPISLRGAGLDASGTRALQGAEPGRVLVAVASSGPARVELSYAPSADMTLAKTAEVVGEGAAVDVQRFPLDAGGAVLAASAHGKGRGFVALDLDIERAQLTGHGVLVTDRAGKVDACHLHAVGTSAPSDGRPFGIHVSRGRFDVSRGDASLLFAQAQPLGATTGSAAFIPVTTIGDLQPAGNYLSGFTRIGGEAGPVWWSSRGCTV